MVKIAAGLVRCAVKLDWKNEVRNFLVHGCKSRKRFRISEVRFRIFLMVQKQELQAADSPRRRCAGRPSLPQAGKRANSSLINKFKNLLPPKAKRGSTSKAMSG